MNKIVNKLNALKNIIKREKFNWKCKPILGTDPLNIEKDKVIILSMLQHSDIIMYLLAIKSFYQHFPRGEIVILNDGTLTDKD